MRIGGIDDDIGGLIDFSGGKLVRACGISWLLQGGGYGIGILRDLVSFLLPNARYLGQDVVETGPSVFCLGREVGATPERKGIRGQEHGERPATLLPQAVKGRHVDTVDIRALFAINLYVDEVLVHKTGGDRVFKTLVSHDMAPVAGGIADGQKNWLVAVLGLLKRLFTPPHPVYWIILVLKEIGAGFQAETVM